MFPLDSAVFTGLDAFDYTKLDLIVKEFSPLKINPRDRAIDVKLSSLQAGSPLSQRHALERRRAKRSGGKESGGEAPRN